ncbi:hypothetical protein SNOG_13343 [Parastagonospora nodorum SN15]|uniref:Rab-GAP TBC domain-containing protein n=1 Tax=Phaeosphaeria nodorum (strain SN15 / ATCC MYA-4574 / FGSC 10173) TaxID=321614 RepID=Q0U4H1_PHANO|nr:hypothetical protein SNOG_13343 [Parastagonospora nodorum SN15]EAT79227.2 hypothetical protein SNOG_13343 [Parastagonospora nodorum SN15]
MASSNTSRSASRSVSRSVSSNSLPPRRTSPVVELSPAEKEKEALIAGACRDRDLSTLVHLATTSSGLISDSLRRTAWPLLLGCSEQDSNRTPWEKLPPHKDEHQVSLDVNRAFVYYPKNESEKQLERRKEELSDVIIHVLRRHPTLCYFQGYHDIVQVFLLVLGVQDAPAAVARLSLLRIRDFMLSTLDPAISQLELLRPIFRAADPELFNHLPKSQPSFALAGTITNCLPTTYRTTRTLRGCSTSSWRTMLLCPYTSSRLWCSRDEKSCLRLIRKTRISSMSCSGSCLSRLTSSSTSHER